MNKYIRLNRSTETLLANLQGSKLTDLKGPEDRTYKEEGSKLLRTYAIGLQMEGGQTIYVYAVSVSLGYLDEGFALECSAEYEMSTSYLGLPVAFTSIADIVAGFAADVVQDVLVLSSPQGDEDYIEDVVALTFTHSAQILFVQAAVMPEWVEVFMGDKEDLGRLLQDERVARHLGE